MLTDSRPVIALTMGDPSGIGPEIIAKTLTLAPVLSTYRPLVIGSASILEEAFKYIGKSVKTNLVTTPKEATGSPGSIDVLDTGDLDKDFVAQGKVSAQSGEASVQWILKASELAASGEVQAIVTAPINKHSCAVAGYSDIGHMEIFQNQTGAKQVATMLISENLRVVHLTTHKSLRNACDYVTKPNVLAKIELTQRSFLKWNFRSPLIGVAALNPHASDGGLIGSEETNEIQPAVTEARSRGINVTGPVSADTIFHQAIDGKFDVVLAMYHDQGHIPIKVHNWKKSISVNLGLPFIRTSVDHGTAFDIAGKGIADNTSMSEALLTAVNLVEGNGLGKGTK